MQVEYGQKKINESEIITNLNESEKSNIKSIKQ